MNLLSISYDCIKVQQTPDAKPMFVTKATAKELLQWCSVPRSRAGFMAGYQRELEDRYKKITDFFIDDPENNIVPNAVLIAVNDKYIQYHDNDKYCTLTIEYPNLAKLDLLDKIILNFEERLNPEEIASIDLSDDTEIIEDDNEIDDSEAIIPPESYLAELTKRLRELRDNPDDFRGEQKDVIFDFVKSISLPGLIIDGQHRVFGAKEVVDFDVEFPVVLIPGLEHKEQVFHFYVINNKAKPLNRTHLRRIIATSLSKKEIEELYDRLKNAGVEAKSAELTYRMNNDDDSPFKGIIDMKLPGTKGSLDENIANTLVTRFMKLGNRYKLLVKEVNEWNEDSYDYKLKCFYAIWAGIKEIYNKAWEQAIQDNATNEQRQILTKVSLIMLQEYVLESLHHNMPERLAEGKPSPLSDTDELKKRVKYSLMFVNEEFFLQPWRKKGLDTSAGHELFMNNLKRAAANQSKNLGNMSLF